MTVDPVTGSDLSLWGFLMLILGVAEVIGICLLISYLRTHWKKGQESGS